MASFVSLFYERSLLLSINGIPGQLSLGRNCAKDFRYSKNKFVRVNAMSSNKNSSNYKMNLNEYMVTLEKPLGIRFAVSVDGKIIVHAIKKGVATLLIVFNRVQFVLVVEIFADEGYLCCVV